MGTGEGVSVVIPSRSEGDGLLQCLDALSAHEAVDEIIVAAHAEAAGVRDEACARPGIVWVDCAAAGRGVQMNAGARLSRSGILLFLHADTRLPDDGARLAGDALRDTRVAGGAFRLAFDRSHPALDLLSWMSASSLRGSFLGDQAMFCRRSLFERLGGFWERPLFEDVDFAERLAREGRVIRIAARVRTSARRFSARGPWRQLARNSALYARYRFGADVGRLARAYES
jgi:rSAM/selenodomain-associated transferase 2